MRGGLDEFGTYILRLHLIETDRPLERRLRVSMIAINLDKENGLEIIAVFDDTACVQGVCGDCPDEHRKSFSCAQYRLG
jgi:hypothetical protein